MSMAFRFNSNLGQVRDHIDDRAEHGMLLAVEHILGVSNDHVPHEEGTLETSGEASVDGMTGAVSYNTPYAVEQHENLTLGHDPGRNAKYLENAFNSERPTALAIIANEIKRGL